MELQVVKTGDTLDIGNGKPVDLRGNADAALAGQHDDLYVGDAVLFSNDAFGQHYCDERLNFSSKWTQTELFEQCQRYYANILTRSASGNAKITESSASTCRWI